MVSIASVANANTAALLISSAMILYSRNVSNLIPIAGVMGTTTYTWASNTANYSGIHAPGPLRNLTFGIATTLSAGVYYLGCQLSTANNSSIGTATTALGATISMPWQSDVVVNWAQVYEFGVNTNATDGLIFQGLMSATITATNQTIGMSDMVMSNGVNHGRANTPKLFRG